MRVSFTNPWWVVVGAVTGFVCNGPVLGFTFGVFLKPIMADMGWDRGVRLGALSSGHVTSALAVPVLGYLMDRWGIRQVALPGLVIYAAFCAYWVSRRTRCRYSHCWWRSPSMTSAIQTPLGYAKAISAWFDRRRGLALGVAMSGVGLGRFIMPQLARVTDRPVRLARRIYRAWAADPRDCVSGGGVVDT